MNDIEIYGSQILRAENMMVTDYNDEFKQLIDEMNILMKKTNGIGLAAPQAGVNKTFFITDAPGDKFRVFVNPSIISTSVEEVMIEEGCLSIPGIYGEINRPRKVVVEAFDVEGVAFRLKTDGMLARVIQHESDHLRGVLFTDYLDEKVQKKLDKKFIEKPKRIKLKQSKRRSKSNESE